MEEPLRYYHNITANAVNVLEAMKAGGTRQVRALLAAQQLRPPRAPVEPLLIAAPRCATQIVFSSTCATYGNPAKLPVTEETPTLPINPYGRAKLMSEQIVRDYARADPALRATVFRYFNVYGGDPTGVLGEYPPPALRQHARIANACMDAALKKRASLVISGAPAACSPPPGLHSRRQKTGALIMLRAPHVRTCACVCRDAAPNAGWHVHTGLHPRR